jgi:hypothetical protein
MRNQITIKNLFLLFGVMLSACSNSTILPQYETQYLPEEDIAVFARVGAAPHEIESSTNHFRIRKSLKAVNFDDLGSQIRPCEQEGTLFCLSGFLPIVLPRLTGIYEYDINGELIKAELLAPEGPMGLTNSGRLTCDVTLSKLTVRRKDRIYEYIISKSHGVVKITQPTTLEPDHWYLVSGRLIDLEAICEN